MQFFTFEGEWNLRISNVGIEDDAVYQCQVAASGSSSPIRSVPAKLRVLVPPAKPIITQGDLVIADEGVETVLECSSKGGRPAAEVKATLLSHYL